MHFRRQWQNRCLVLWVRWRVVKKNIKKMNVWMYKWRSRSPRRTQCTFMTSFLCIQTYHSWLPSPAVWRMTNTDSFIITWLLLIEHPVWPPVCVGIHVIFTAWCEWVNMTEKIQRINIYICLFTLNLNQLIYCNIMFIILQMCMVMLSGERSIQILYLSKSTNTTL